MTNENKSRFWVPILSLLATVLLAVFAVPAIVGCMSGNEAAKVASSTSMTVDQVCFAAPVMPEDTPELKHSKAILLTLCGDRERLHQVLVKALQVQSAGDAVDSMKDAKDFLAPKLSPPVAAPEPPKQE